MKVRVSERGELAIPCLLIFLVFSLSGLNLAFCLTSTFSLRVGVRKIREMAILCLLSPITAHRVGVVRVRAQKGIKRANTLIFLLFSHFNLNSLSFLLHVTVTSPFLKRRRKTATIICFA